MVVMTTTVKAAQLTRIGGTSTSVVETPAGGDGDGGDDGSGMGLEAD